MSSSTATIALEGTGPRGKQPSRINPYWVLVLPLVLFLLVIYLYPIGQVLWISFSSTGTMSWWASASRTCGE